MRTNRRVAGLLVLFVAAVALLVPNLRRSQAQTGNSGESFAVGGITTLDGHLAFSAHLNPKKKTPRGMWCRIAGESQGVVR